MSAKPSFYILMNKNTPILTCAIDEMSNNNISKIIKHHNPEYLPVGLNSISSDYFRKGLNEWFQNRSIPASRQGLSEALHAMGAASSSDLLTKSWGLSLSDQYWLNPNGELHWKDINFFDNPFSEEVGLALFGKRVKPRNVDFRSPDITSDGWLQKRWEIIEDKRTLVKGGSGVYKQEPINEVIATTLLDELGIDHVQYQLRMDGKKPYSLCENFITPDTELVTAWQIFNSAGKKSNNDSDYMHFMRGCEGLGIEGMEEHLNQLLALDYIIANTDRHYGNFGAIRDVNTLKFVSIAPIYDSGTSLWHDTETLQIVPLQDVESRSFYDSHEKQLKVITAFDKIDFNKLETFHEKAQQVLSHSYLVDERRKNILSRGIQKRIN